MITEYEIATIIEDLTIKEEVSALKKKFLKAESPLYKMNNHDFLSLILLTPHVGVALANGSVSLFEELSLNKKARKFSRGGTFLRKDPVVHAMNLLINGYDKWEEEFLAALASVMYQTFEKSHLLLKEEESNLPSEEFHRLVMKTPYIFVKYLKAFFLTEEDAIPLERKISAVEYDKVLFIGKKLGLEQVAIFKMFCATFNVK